MMGSRGDAIGNLLALLKDHKAAEKFLKDMDKKIKESKKLVKSLGGIQEIDKLRETAAKDAAAAQKILDGAAGEAESVVREANNDAATQKIFIEKKTTALKKREKAVESAEKALAIGQQEFVKKSDALNVETQSVNRKQVDLDRALEEIETTRAAMKRLVA